MLNMEKNHITSNAQEAFEEQVTVFAEKLKWIMDENEGNVMEASIVGGIDEVTGEYFILWTGDIVKFDIAESG